MTDLSKFPIYKAKMIDKDRYVRGFYFAYPKTTYCFTTDYINNPVKIIHCIVTHKTGDWGLPNEPRLYQIDIDTLEQVGEFNALRKKYGDEPWIEHYNKTECADNA